VVVVLKVVVDCKLVAIVDDSLAIDDAVVDSDDVDVKLVDVDIGGGNVTITGHASGACT
jgi:cell division ATPase FtsA